MTHARDRKYWSKLVEEKLNLSENCYSRKNTKHQAAELQSCNIKTKLRIAQENMRSMLLLS